MPEPQEMRDATLDRSAIALRRTADVFERLPYGLLVLEGRRVSGSNPAARRLLWDVTASAEGPLCQDLFDCRGSGGPCEHGCLVERAAMATDPLPEIRIDATSSAAVTALWVTAARLANEGTVVLHVRPGDARDRRRRSDPHWLSGPELRISAFGRTWVDSREGPMGGQWLQQRPGQILKYLVCERNRVVHAEEVAEALWPGAGRQSINNVRHFMHALRQKLEPERPRGAESSFVVTVQGGYALNRRRVRIDADEFEEAAREGLAAAAGDSPTAGVERMEEALALYRGDLIEDEPYAEWAYDERDRLRSLAAQVLRRLVTSALAREELGAAASALERLAEIEPYDAATQRDLLAVMLGQGRRTEAARRYQAYKARMAREFGEEPDFTLADARLPAAAGPSAA